jgi:hypothetical protein
MQVSPAADGQLAVSPDGNTVAYLGIDDKIHYYRNVDDINYTYHDTIDNDRAGGSGSLQFAGNNDMFYISNITEDRTLRIVQRLKYQESYCENRALADWPGF